MFIDVRKGVSSDTEISISIARTCARAHGSNPRATPDFRARLMKFPRESSESNAARGIHVSSTVDNITTKYHTIARVIESHSERHRICENVSRFRL